MRRSLPHMRRHLAASAATAIAAIAAVALFASPASAQATPSAPATATVGTDAPRPQRSPAGTKLSAAPEPADTGAPDPTEPPPEPDPTTPPPDPTTPPPGPDPNTPPPDSPPTAKPTPTRPRPSSSPSRSGDTQPQPGAGAAHRSGSPDTAGAHTDPSGPSLPVTGDRLVPIVGTGAAALIGGIGLLLAGRRRTR